MQNQINDIEVLPNIIQPFKNLKLLDLRNNPIGKEKVENVVGWVFRFESLLILRF